MEEIKVKAPAKINLGLNVVSESADGYHNIETIFYPVEDLYDVLTFRKSDSFKFTADKAELNISSNLIIRAKELLEKETNRNVNIDVHLEKNIPVGAGLGGGSSDAAAALKTINKLLDLNLDVKVLKNLALQLGSDVPFFLDPKPCYAFSRGEKTEEINIKINCPVLIVNPGIHISTKWAYSKINPKIPEFNLSSFTQNHLLAPEKLSDILKNDFEEIVFREYPQIKKLKDELENSGALFTLMSGSGSSIFSLYKDNKTAEEIKTQLGKRYFVFLRRYD